ncbi:helix-turn-helix domain-containing protein [Latilactobacillus graminis]|uniref:Mga helix-turn-helix domain-containing protein n=1 Tax=Latilactobacillus graminis TaxID=60519 RepID=A0ABX6C9G6_9LACO|nr:helix-turn-helix domain-containing protein [Latilactobacillus graminis]QFP78880.1 hypothetical protein LG542_00835 [Latilactobacillus graminis]
MNTNSVYLTQAEKEKYALFLDVTNVKWDELPVKKRISMARQVDYLIDDVNLKQVAALLDRSYGSLYNMYMSMVSDLQSVLGKKTDDTRQLFKIPSDVYHFYMVKNSDVYDFVQILLHGGQVSFQSFWEQHHSSKATALRHLKQVRDLIRAFNVRIAYDPIHLEGDEKAIRIVLVMLYWLAAGGHTWVFDEIDQQAAHEAFDYAVEAYQLQTPNLLTREIGAYMIAISYYRVMQGKTIEADDRMELIRYPYPDLTHAYLVADFTQGSSDLRAKLAQLSPTQSRSESAGLYFILKYGPVPLKSKGRFEIDECQIYKRYVPEVYWFVNHFLERTPVDIQCYLNISERVYHELKNALSVVTTNIHVLGNDMTSVVSHQLMERVKLLRPNEQLHADISQTIDYLLFEPEARIFAANRDALVKAYYNLIRQLVQQYRPVNRVKVALVVEQDYLGYMDLLAALENIQYVDFSTSDDALRDADLVVTTSSIALPDYTNPAAVPFIWRLNANSDHFARLYGIIRELWIQKSHIENSEAN